MTSTTSSPTSLPRDVSCPKCGSTRFYRAWSHVLITTPCTLEQTGEKHMTAHMDWPKEIQDDTEETTYSFYCAECDHDMDMKEIEVEYDG